MSALVQLKGKPQVFLVTGGTSVHVKDPATLKDYQQLHAEGTLVLGNAGKVRVVTNRRLIGVILGDVPEGFTANP